MYPFGDNPSPDSQVSILFDKETVELKQIQLKASSLNITSSVVINAAKPITPTYFGEQDLSFPGYNCT